MSLVACGHFHPAVTVGNAGNSYYDKRGIRLVLHFLSAKPQGDIANISMGIR
jgi:hypothetical protein